MTSFRFFDAISDALSVPSLRIFIKYDLSFLSLFISSPIGQIDEIMLKYKWLSWLGLFFLIYLTLMMLYDGINEFEVAKTFIQQISI